MLNLRKYFSSCLHKYYCKLKVHFESPPPSKFPTARQISRWPSFIFFKIVLNQIIKS